MQTTRIRPIGPADIDGLERFYAELSADDRRTRFLHVGARLSEAQAVSFCRPDHAHRDGFVAVATDASGRERIVGHLCLEPDGVATAEVAVAVAVAFQGHGVGRQLLDAGVTWAQREGIRSLTATMYVDNAPIQRLLRGLARPTVERSLGCGVSEVQIDISGLSLAA